ncbi:kinase-like domain-containing protein [Pseudomassariella vexata]|uniref:Kinase-like domain-containing protein n=1 Tax=Pseudomassariella vexata TaxID=1141098 RepID=A0A1Y2D8V3_9PEZI|nr:kinase-like domain-containing protein [Pseudomassariella vexata]ORY55690.1 kinase-like domain-containing protein [Pseudomassariella vexata]
MSSTAFNREDSADQDSEALTQFSDDQQPDGASVPRPSGYASQHDDMQSDVAQSDTAHSDASTYSVSTASRPISLSHSQGATDEPGVDDHRHMMLASLLEDHFRMRAAEFLNTTNGTNYTRHSREVQPLARQLFAQATQTLSSNGLLSPTAASEPARDVRRQYLVGLDSLVAGASGVQAPPTSILEPMRDLAAQASQFTILTHPATDLELRLQVPRSRIQYQATFRELGLLGKGGFGKVFKCYNRLDQKTYAVKKIPLSPKLTKRLCQDRHEDMQSVLREVQVLAMLDHVNVVRYHATWIEEPQHEPEQHREVGLLDHEANTKLWQRPPLLLESRRITQVSDDDLEPSFPKEQSGSCGIVFAEDTPSCPDANNHKPPVTGLQWSDQLPSGESAIETQSGSDSDIFTDGQGAGPSRIDHPRVVCEDDTGVHVLHIQMSMYPMTLAQYLAPTSGDGPKHCFHLIPTLRLLLSILEGLQYIHAKGLVHRDIKPGNIFLSHLEDNDNTGYCNITCRSCPGNKGQVWLNPRIGDFGLVAQLAHEVLLDEDTLSSKPVGTPYYRPPIWNTEKHNEKTDVFALGVVFVEMMCRCGTTMERVDMLKGLQRGQIPLGFAEAIEAEGFGAETDDLVRVASSMVDPDPAQRYSDKQVKDAIEAILERVSQGELFVA